MIPLVLNSFGWKPALKDRKRPVVILIDYDGEMPNIPDAYKVFIQQEPPVVRADVTPRLLREAGKFDLILTWCKEVHEMFPLKTRYYMNANLSLVMDSTRSAQCGNDYRPSIHGFFQPPAEKIFGVSFVTSDKNWAPGHQFRQHVFAGLPAQIGDLKVFKHRSPPFIDRRLVSVPYQYEIVMENSRFDNYFTDKIIDPMAAKTVPIYWGAQNINKFFNVRGMLRFETGHELVAILNSLKPEHYGMMKSAIDENYLIAHQRADLIGIIDGYLDEYLGEL